MKKCILCIGLILFSLSPLSSQEMVDLSDIVQRFSAQDYSRTLELMELYRPRSKNEQFAISYLKAHCFLKQKDYDLAIAAFSDLLQVLPNNYEILNNIGVAYYQKKDYKSALRYFNLSFLSDTGFKAAQSNYNIALEQLKKSDRNLVLSPIDDNDVVLNSSGWFYYYLGDIEKSVFYFKEAIDGSPKFSQNYIDIAYVLDDSKQYQLSLKYLSMAEKLDPENPAIVDNLGILYHHLGKDDKAEEYFSKAMDLNKGFAEPRNNKGFLLLGKKEYQSAATLFAESMAVNGYSQDLFAESLAGLALCQYCLGDDKSAKENKERAVEKNFKLSDAKYVRGFLQWDEEIIALWAKI